MAGMISAAAASSSIEDCVDAAVRLKNWRSRLRPPKNIAAPRTSRTLPMIEPTIEALTTSCRPAPSAKRAMMSSGAFPKVTLSSPPMPGPERTASSSVARPMSAAVGMTPSAEAKKVGTAPSGRARAGGGLHGARGRDASIGLVRRPPVALLATVLAVLLAPVAAHAQAPRTVASELDALLAAGAIDQPHHDVWAESYDNAKATLRQLHGTRRRQLDAVIANTRAIANAGLLTPTRAPLVFLTLQRNRAWWSEGPLLRYGQREMFAGSQLVWQYYPGQGLQGLWLGTFGRANGLFQQGG